MELTRETVAQAWKVFCETVGSDIINVSTQQHKVLCLSPSDGMRQARGRADTTISITTEDDDKIKIVKEYTV